MNNRIRAITVLIFACIMSLASVTVQAESRAPEIILAKVLDPSVDPSKYLVSEKYDGVRAIWDGKTLRFRSGATVNAPAWFVARLPLQPLDGELWLAREKFETLSGFVRKSEPVESEWKQIKYMIFEMPGAEGTFAERAARIQDIVAMAAWDQLVAVKQYRVKDRAELKRKFDEVVKGGGEGLMLHRADAPYLTGRSDALLKLKPLDDTEAKVIAHVPGKGKYAGMMGALRVESPEGVRFTIGTGFSDAQRKNPPPVGSEVTYTYRGLTKNGVPRFSSFLRIREKF
jgi:DNA ligase-1